MTITLKDSQGRLLNYQTEAGAQQAMLELGYTPASVEEIATYDAAKKEREQYGTAGQQALALGELAADAATFGIAKSDSPEAQARRRQLRRESPVLATGAEIAGSLLPGVAAGGLGGLALGARAATTAGRVGLGLASDFASGLSLEAEQADEQGRRVDVGNVAMWTLGGALPEGAIRAAARSLSKARPFRNNVVPSALTTAADMRSGKAFGQTERELSETEIRKLVENWDESVNATRSLAHDAGNSFQDSFDAAHAIYLKPEDIRGRVVENVKAQQRFFEGTTERAATLVDNLEKRGYAKTAGAIRQHLEDLNSAADSADLFISGDQLKRTVQRFRKKAASGAAKSGTDPFHELVAEFDAVEKPLRRDLEDAKVWGKDVAAKQAEENALWSGKDGFIHNAAEFNRAFLRPEAAGADYDGIQHWLWDDDKFKAFLAKDAISQRDVLRAGDKMLDAAESMIKVKERLGIRPEDMIQLKQDLADMRAVVSQARELTQARTRGAALLKRAEERAGQPSLTRQVAGSVIAGGVGSAVGGVIGGPVGALAGAATGASVARRLDDFFAPLRPEGFSPMLSREQAREALERRFSDLAPAQPSAAKAGAANEFSALGVPRKTAELTAQAMNGQDLQELSEHGRGYLRRQAELFVSGGPRQAALKPAPERFQGEFHSLRDAYLSKVELLKDFARDPSILSDHLADSFGAIPETHPALFSQLVVRASQGVAYLAQNIPPGVRVSLKDPAGKLPSLDAMRDFARKWEAVWNPANVFRDIATGRATPQQLRAVQAVHPDLFAEFQIRALTAMSNRATPPGYETQRYIDQVMQLDGAYNEAMSKSVARNVRSSLAADTGKPPAPSGMPLPTGPGVPHGISALAMGPTFGAG